VAIVTLAAVLTGSAGAVAGCASVAGDPSGGTAVSELRNDLGVPVTVAICADDRCAALAGSVTDRLAPGQTLPVNVSVDGAGETYAVNRAGAPTRCLPVAPHAYAVRPTLSLSAAVPCAAAPAVAAPGVFGSALQWLSFAVVLLLGVLAWVVAVRSTMAAYRRLRGRWASRAAAAVIAALAGLAVLLLLWPFVLVRAAVHRARIRPAWRTAGR
jgi:hypothetical protein